MRERFHTDRNDGMDELVISANSTDATLATDVTALVRRWLAVASDVPATASAQQLAGEIGRARVGKECPV